MNTTGINDVNRTASMFNAFALLLGVFFLAEGIWGLFREMVFGVLSTNNLHALIHIILGVTGIVVSRKESARMYCRYVGILLLAVGFLRFVPGIDDLVVRALNVNYKVAALNLILGTLGVALSYYHQPKNYRVA